MVMEAAATPTPTLPRDTLNEKPHLAVQARTCIMGKAGGGRQRLCCSLPCNSLPSRRGSSSAQPSFLLLHNLQRRASSTMQIALCLSNLRSGTDLPPLIRQAAVISKRLNCQNRTDREMAWWLESAGIPGIELSLPAGRNVEGRRRVERIHHRDTPDD